MSMYHFWCIPNIIAVSIFFFILLVDTEVHMVMVQIINTIKMHLLWKAKNSLALWGKKNGVFNVSSNVKQNMFFSQWHEMCVINVCIYSSTSENINLTVIVVTQVPNLKLRQMHIYSQSTTVQGHIVSRGTHSLCRINLHFLTSRKEQLTLSVSLWCKRICVLMSDSNVVMCDWLSCRILCKISLCFFAAAFPLSVFFSKDSFGLMMHCDYLMVRMLLSFRLAEPFISNTTQQPYMYTLRSSHVHTLIPFMRHLLWYWL